MDYIHPTVIRLTLHVVVILALIAYAAWAVQSLWSVQGVLPRGLLMR
jgi:succinate dehydrogenase / fumarate reductase membrane anchor subunit